MSYYTVDPYDMAPYEGAKLPTLTDGVMVIESLSANLKSYELDYDTIRKTVMNYKGEASSVYNPDGSSSVLPDQRSSQLCHADPQTAAKVAERLTFVLNYHLSYTGDKFKLCEPLQFLKYDSTNRGHFGRHTDSSYMHDGKFMYVTPARKLTTITYLNDDYEGGELVLDTVKDPSGHIFYRKLEAGATVIFPADLRFPHEVKPVTKGVRYSIVAWFDYAYE